MYAVVHRHYVEYVKARPWMINRSAREIFSDLEALLARERPLTQYVVLSLHPDNSVEMFCRATEWLEPDAPAGVQA